jgi:uroporphyrinogen-III synthase
MRLLITRPEPDAAQTLADLRAQGHDGIAAPLLHIECEPDLKIGPGPFSAVLMTSANAARAVGAVPAALHLLALPTFTVGNRTAEAAHNVGFTTIISAAGDQRDLVRLVARQGDRSNGTLLYLAGADRAGDLAADLGREGFAVRTVVVYRARMADVLPRPAHDALQAGTIDGVLHYSRRSAQAFMQCAEASGLLKTAVKLPHYCLSAEVAVPLAQAGAMAVHIAPRPDGVALLELLRPS